MVVVTETVLEVSVVVTTLVVVDDTVLTVDEEVVSVVKVADTVEVVEVSDTVAVVLVVVEVTEVSLVVLQLMLAGESNRYFTSPPLATQQRAKNKQSESLKTREQKTPNMSWLLWSTKSLSP